MNKRVGRIPIHGHGGKGKNRSATYYSWAEMRSRCRNPKKSNYKYYGGRGIGVDPRWDSFANFLSDMGERPANTTLDRIDCDLDYSPENCRWASKIEQANNTRANRLFVLNCRMTTLAQLSRETGLGAPAIRKRIKLGWTIQEVVSTPKNKRLYPHPNQTLGRKL